MKNVFWKILVLLFVVIACFQFNVLISDSPEVSRQNARDEIRERVRVERLNESELEKKDRVIEENKKKIELNKLYSKNKIRNWYDGATLHKSSVSNWRTATHRDKLATCGDWMAVVDNKISMEELKDRAEKLLICIDEAVAMDEYGQKISGNLQSVDIATGCITLLRY
jgi:hypothetical protein